MQSSGLFPGRRGPWIARARTTLLGLAIALGSTRAVAASGLASIVREVAEGLKDAPAGTLVATAPLVSDVAGARSDELASRLAALVAGRLEKGARPAPRAMTLAQARAQLKDTSSLLFLAPVIEKGRLSVSADLYAVPKNGWDRIRAPSVAPKSHTFAQAAIDAELRSYLPAILLEQAAISKAKLDDSDVLAAACGDVTGDGGLELALVTKNRVVLGRLERGRFRVDHAVPWAALLPRAPVPLREPIATAAFIDDRLLVGISDRGGVALDSELNVASRLRALPIHSTGGVEACTIVAPAQGGLEGAVACSTLAATQAKLALPTPRFDAIVAAVLIARDGAESVVLAAREPSGKARVRFSGAETEARGIDAGAELALFDFDLDGAPELAVSADAQGAEDGITLYTLTRGAEPRLRRRIPTPTPVRALAACPPEANAAPGLVAVVGAELWLVR